MFIYFIIIDQLESRQDGCLQHRQVVSSVAFYSEAHSCLPFVIARKINCSKTVDTCPFFERWTTTGSALKNTRRRKYINQASVTHA